MDKHPPEDDPGRLLADRAIGVADRAIEQGTRGWFANLDSNQQVAWCALVAALALGPIGGGALAAVKALFGGALPPTVSQIEAWGWLVIITLPLFAWLAIVGFALGKAGLNWPAVFLVAGIAAYFAGALIAASGIPSQLGDFFCYAYLDGLQVEYEKQCRAFDALGFL